MRILIPTDEIIGSEIHIRFNSKVPSEMNGTLMTDQRAIDLIVGVLVNDKQLSRLDSLFVRHSPLPIEICGDPEWSITRTGDTLEQAEFELVVGNGTLWGGDAGVRYKCKDFVRLLLQCAERHTYATMDSHSDFELSRLRSVVQEFSSCK